VIGQRLMMPFLTDHEIRWDADFATRANCGEEALESELESESLSVAGGMRG
jgi:hypothetical protein